MTLEGRAGASAEILRLAVKSHHSSATEQQLAWDGHQKPHKLVRIPVKTRAQPPHFTTAFPTPRVSAVSDDCSKDP